MRRAVLFLVLTSLRFSGASAQSSVADWFPVHPGDKWTYSHETRDDTGEGPAHLEVRRWKTEETIIRSWTVPEGTLLDRKVRITDGSLPEGWHMHQEQPYLIRGNCLYTREVGWDLLQRQLTPEYREDLLAGRISADFCFPLAVGKSWGAPHWANWRSPSDAKDWQVQSVFEKENTYHLRSISSYLGSGMTADIWFRKGVGVVREDQIHHGTIGEEQTKLLGMQRQGQR